MDKWIIKLPEDRIKTLERLQYLLHVVSLIQDTDDEDSRNYSAMQEFLLMLHSSISTAEPMTIKEYRETKTLDKILSDMQNNIGYLESQKEQLIQKQKQLETEINTTLTLLDYIKEIRSEND